MEVGHGFAAVRTVVDDHAEAIFGKSFLFCDRGGGEQEVAEEGLVGGVGFSHARDGLARDHEDVNGCLWGNVAESDAMLILVDEGGRDFPVADFLEEGLFGHFCGEAWHGGWGSARLARLGHMEAVGFPMVRIEAGGGNG